MQAEANGTDAQRAALERWVSAQGIDAGAVRWYADEGFSGAKAARPGYQALLAAVRAGEVRTVAAYSLSRLGRSTRALMELVEELRERGVRLVVLKESIDLDTPTGRLFFTILSALAEYEREVIAERIRDGVRTRIAKGQRWGAAGRPVRPGTPGYRRWTDAERADILARRAKGQKVAAIAAALNADWQAVYRVLRSKQPVRH
jgi:DNA invertase Pin-like site-specific DNA recombinase